jgi:uncharacterized tellurite resistance protein B-like protein
MGLFSKLFSSENVAYEPKNEQEAWVAIMTACMTVDGSISDTETDAMVRLLVFKKSFSGHNLVDYFKGIQKPLKEYGSQGLIEKSVSKVSDDFKPTLFCLVVEMLIADGRIGEQEEEIIEYLSGQLKLDEKVSSQIIKVYMIRNKGNVYVRN